MSKINDRLEKLSFLIPDQTLRHIIFNYDDIDEDFLSDDESCLYYLQNILVFSTLVVLNAFLSWKKENKNTEHDEFSNSMLRMYNMLNRAYDPNKITGDFIDNIIINLVIDYSLNQNEIISFSQTIGVWDYFNFPQTNNNLSKYIYMLKQRRISSKYKSYFTFENLCECIEMFSFLRSSKAIIKNKITETLNLGEIIIEYRGVKLELNYSMCVAFDYPKNKVYYMYDFDFIDDKKCNEKKKKNQSLILNYNCFDSTDSFKIVVLDSLKATITLLDDCSGYCLKSPTAIEDFLIEYDILNINSKTSTSLFFKDYILINNKYIKELSLTISDALTSKTKDEIVYRLSQYKDIFDKMTVASFYNTGNAIGRRWDEIVLFLMLEEGIYDFLKLILQYQEYGTFLTSFYNRFGKARVNSICNEEQFLKNAERKAKYIPSKDGQLDYFANALIMLASKILTSDVLNLTKNIYPTSIDDVFEEVDNIFRSHKHSEEDKILCLTNTVIRITTFLYTFYCGVVMYATNKKSAILSLEEDKENYLDEYNNYKRIKEKWIEEFRIIVNKSSYGTVCKANGKVIGTTMRNKKSIIKQLSMAFNALINIESDLSKRGYVDSEVFYDILGRRQLFDCGIIESYKKSIIEAVDADISYPLYMKVKCFLNYLKVGIDCASEVDTDYSIENAIYPLVGQYFSSVTSRDGYRYSYFKVDTNVNTYRKSLNIKIITDDSFDFGQSYFCVPNTNRVATVGGQSNFNKNRIWVSPVIIPCSIFLPKTTTEIDVLEKSSEFESAAELIYDSDPYIYGNLFGSLENAKKVFPELFRTKNCKFYKDHYYVIKKDGELIAIAAMYKSDNCIWDTDVILKAFGNAGIQPPSTFYGAVKHMEDIFNESMGSSLYLLDDLCVKDSYRNKGMGRSLVWYIIKEAEKDGASIVLSAYSENSSALELYTYMGFIPYSKNTYIGNEGKDYFKMIRI